MPAERKPSQRDITLISILERLSEQLQQYDARLEEISKNQIDLSGATLRTQIRLDARQDGAEVSIEKLQESLARFRSDMLSMVNEQGRIDDTLKELAKKQRAIAEAQEEISRDLAGLKELSKSQEKTSREHFEHSVRQSGEVGKEFADVNHNIARMSAEAEKNIGNEHGDLKKQILDTDRKIAKLHEDTEKHLGDGHKDIQRQITELRQETKRRLLALDGIEASLQILMIRTEPPEKKPFIAVRMVRGVRQFLKFKVPEVFRRITSGFRKER